jgi:tetratricopeptide (TPR) repeat protein
MRRMVVWMAAALLLATATPPSAALSAETATPPVTAPDAPAARPAVDDTLRHALDTLRQDVKELSGKVETNGLDIARLQAASSGQDTLRQDVKELSEKVETNGREIARLESASGGQDQRLGDINNRIGDVNLWLAGFSALVTLLLASAGVLTYWGARERAGAEARTAAQAWIDENAEKLRQQLVGLEKEAEGHKARMKTEADGVVEHGRKMHSLLDGLQAESAASASSAEKEALKQADTALTAKPEQDYTADDWNLRAYAAASRANWDEAAVYFAKAADSPGATKEQEARALFNRGVVLGKGDRYDEEIVAYAELVKRHADTLKPDSPREWVARALANMGVALGKGDRHGEALATYAELLNRFDSAPELKLREAVAKGLANKGFSLGKLDRYEEALAALSELVNRFDGAQELGLREQVANALINKSLALGQLGRHKEAITAYVELVKRFDSAQEPKLREAVAWALNGIGWQHYESRDASQFLVLTERALAAEPRLNYALANRAFALHLNGQPAAGVLAAYARARRVIPDPVKWRELAVEDLQKHAERWPEAAPIDAGLIDAVAAM